MWNLFDQTFTLRLTIALLHFLWQGALIAVAAAIAGGLLRRASANTRYGVNVAALTLMSVCLAVTFAWVSIDAPPPPVSSQDADLVTSTNNPESAVRRSDAMAVAPKTITEVPNVAPMPSSTDGAQLTPRPEMVDAKRVRESEPVVAESASPAPSGIPGPTLLMQSAPYVVAAYLLGVVVLLIRLVFGAWGSRRLRRTATEIVDAELLNWLRQHAKQIGMRFVPTVRRCAEISVPVVIGVLRPVILLPAAAATGLSMNQLQAVIAHELAHVRRYDLIVNLLQRVIETLLFFHPAVWWISRQISREREEACDELVISTGYERTQYADALLRMAEISSQQRDRRRAAPVTTLAADGAVPTDFKRRILKILAATESPHLRPGRSALFLAVTAAVLVIVLSAAGVHLSRTATADPANSAEEADKTLAFLKSLKPDAKLTNPAARGRALAKVDLAAKRKRILYCGEPWSAGKPLIDDETGYPVEIVAGCILTPDFIQLVGSYNTAMKAHFHSRKQNAPPDALQKQIYVGMTFDEVIAAKGKHYRPQVGMGVGQMFLVYDDVIVGVNGYGLRKRSGKVFRIDPTPPDIDQLVGNIQYADAESRNPQNSGTNPGETSAQQAANPRPIATGKQESAFLKVLNPNGTPARIRRVQNAQRGFPLFRLPPWFGEPRSDGLVSLAELPDATDWLVVGGTVFASRQPDEPHVFERTLLPGPGMSPRNDNLSIKVSVVRDDSRAELLRIAIENRTGAALEVSERDIRLETGMPVGEPLWGLSPNWTSDAPDRFPITTIHDGQTGQIDVNWRRWVREGLWYQRFGPDDVQIGPTLSNPLPDEISVRVWVRTHGAIPAQVKHPRILAADNPWPGAGTDTPQFKQRTARVALDRKRLQGTWRLKSFHVKGSDEDVRDFPLPRKTVRQDEPVAETTDASMVISQLALSGVPNVIGRWRKRPAPEGPILESRKGFWLLNESYDPPTFDVTIPADESSGKKAVRRQFLYRFTENGGRVQLELACGLTDPAWAPGSWTVTPLLIYTFELQPASASLPPLGKPDQVPGTDAIDAKTRRKLERLAATDPDHIHAMARFTQVPCAWKWSLYLPAGHSWRIYCRSGSIPHQNHIQQTSDTASYEISRTDQKRIIDLEAFLGPSPSDDGKIMLWVEADREIFQGVRHAVWTIDPEVADYVKGVTPNAGITSSHLDAGRVTTKNAGRSMFRLPFSSMRFHPVGSSRDDLPDLLPGFCVWVEADPKTSTASGQARTADASPNSAAKGFTETRNVTLSIGSMKFLLDLDTGKTMAPPAVNTPEQAQMDLHPNQDQGYNRPTALVSRSVFLLAAKGRVFKGVKVRPADWDATPAEVNRTLNSQQAKALTKLEFDSKTPATWFFRTADGSDGILQLTEQVRVKDAVNQPWGLSLRFKTIPRDAIAPPPQSPAPDDPPKGEPATRAPRVQSEASRPN